MSKTKEELMMPRYMVIAKYPHSPYNIGEILNYVSSDLNPIYDYFSNGIEGIDVGEVLESTAIFRPMPWYEGRSADEMPEYVKVEQFDDRGVIKFKGLKKYIKTCGSIEDYLIEFHISDFLPATLEEFEAYKKRKK